MFVLAPILNTVTPGLAAAVITAVIPLSDGIIVEFPLIVVQLMDFILPTFPAKSVGLRVNVIVWLTDSVRFIILFLFF